MATCRDIITRALRKLNVVALGEDVSTAEAQNAMAVLTSLYMEMIGWGAFGRLWDVIAKADITPYEQSRVRKVSSSIVVTLPVTLPVASPFWSDWGDSDSFVGSPYWGYDPVAADGERPPRDGALIEVNCLTDNEAHSYVYMAQTARWVDLTGLDLNDPAPMSDRFAEPLANVLAGRMATEYGTDVSPALQLAIRNGLQAVTMRFGSAAQPVTATYF